MKNSLATDSSNETPDNLIVLYSHGKKSGKNLTEEQAEIEKETKVFSEFMEEIRDAVPKEGSNSKILIKSEDLSESIADAVWTDEEDPDNLFNQYGLGAPAVFVEKSEKPVSNSHKNVIKPLIKPSIKESERNKDATFDDEVFGQIA